jgi:hypothetical protein
MTAMLALPAAQEASAGRTARTWSSDESFILLRSGDDSVMMRGSLSDLRKAGELRSGGEPLLFVRRSGRSYVIRDAAVLRQAEAIVKPQAELGARQGELGARQGALGARQGELGSRQAALALRHVSGKPSEDDARTQEALARQQEALGRQQEALGAEQERLGRQQERLGREAEVKMRALVDDALRRGIAREVG